MALPAVSHRAQLLTAFVTVVVGATAGLTYDAYRTNLATLEVEARRDGAAAAKVREQALERMLANRQRRAVGLLAGAREVCAEVKPDGRFAWPAECIQPMLNAFRLAEGASGAVITYDRRDVVASGTAVRDVSPAPGALARIVWAGDRPMYVMRAELDGLAMRVQYGSAEVLAILGDASSLGKGGEAILFDSDGRFLAAPRYSPAGARSAAAAAGIETVDACRRGPGELLADDYRGVRTLHAFHPVRALEDACVDAHTNWAEALQPAQDLRDRLLARGLIFILTGAIFSLIASHRIAAPVQRLARAAHALRKRIDEPIPVGGPSEVRALGLALRDTSTELAALVAREQAARREAQTANRAKDRFLAAVSHELRTPLTAILGWTRIIRSQPGLPPLDPTVDRGLKAIERNAEIQRRLVEDLLDVSRIIAGRLRLDKHMVQLASVVERALDAVRPQADEKGVGVFTRIEHPGLAVVADPLRLQQVVSNLAANAVKFSRMGGSVLVSVNKVDDAVQLSVRDEGEGIDPAALPHVFDWFWQGETDPAHAQPGLGLGLGIVRQLVEIHGGSVRAESDGHGLGSCFIVTLPLATEVPVTPDRPAAVTVKQSSFNVH